MTPEPTKDYVIAVSFTGLESLTVNTNAGGKCFVKNRNTREVKYLDAKARTTIIANLPISSNNFTTAFSQDDVLEIGMMGEEHGTTTHTVDLNNKGGIKITIPVIATTSTTHPGITL